MANVPQRQSWEPCARLTELPPSMSERAAKARQLAAANPNRVEVDDETLPWMYSEEDQLWYSFDGNYSSVSPQLKRQQAFERREKTRLFREEAERRAVEQIEEDLYWSGIRQAVLDRDNHTCQMCGYHATTRLHIHHILKRREGGTNHLDNLITCCNKCHKAMDTRLYDPEWVRPTGERTGTDGQD